MGTLKKEEVLTGVVEYRSTPRRDGAIRRSAVSTSPRSTAIEL